MDNWISVKDRLPELAYEVKNTKYSWTVIIALSDNEVSTGQYAYDKLFNKKRWHIDDRTYDGISGVTVTHWQPLPDHPNKSK